MPCVVCESPLTQKGVLVSEMFPDQEDVPEDAWMAQGQLHCPKCKLAYESDPHGEQITPDLIPIQPPESLGEPASESDKENEEAPDDPSPAQQDDSQDHR